MNETNTRIVAAADTSFPSFLAMRAKHSELLQLEPDTEEGKEQWLKEIKQFIEKVQATGAILSEDEERRSGQNILNYWVSTLYRQDQVARLVTLADFVRSFNAAVSDGVCPYPGVRAFSENDHPFFFGRQRQIAYMMGRLKEDRLLVIVGPSGSGKTSLVQAGLLPALRREQSEHFVLPPILPGSRPLRSLALMIQNAKGASEPGSEWVDQQVELFRKDQGHLLKLIEEFTDKPVVIFIDQGEELYERSMPRLLRPFENIFDFDNSRQTVEPFLDNLISVLKSSARKHIIVVARRSGDFEPYIKRLPTRVREVFEPARVVLPALYASELSDAIQQPAELLGIKFEERMVHEEDSTTDPNEKQGESILSALVKEISSEPVGLPLLQFVLPLLWEKREGKIIPDQAFRELRSCRAALSDTAEKFYTSLDSSDQRACRFVLTQMVALDSDLKPHIIPVRRSTLHRGTERAARVDNLIEGLSKMQLVRITKGEMPADDWVELTHDSLIRTWPTMSNWIDSKKWARRRSQALKVMGVAAVIAGVMLLAFLAIGWQQQRAKARDLARLSNKQLANNRFDLAMVLGFAAYETEESTATRSNLHKLLYNLQFTPQLKRFLRKENFEAVDLSFSLEPHHPPSRLAAINRGGKIVIWNLNWGPVGAPSTEQTLTTVSDATYPLIFSPDGEYLASASSDVDAPIILWKVATGEPQHLSFSETEPTEQEDAESEADSDGGPRTLCLVFKPDGKTLFSASEDGAVIQWDLKDPSQAKTTLIYQHPIRINAMALNTAGDLLVVGDDDGAVFLLDVSGKKVRPRVIARGHVTETVGDEAIHSVAFGANGQLVAASRVDHAMVWQVSGTLQHEFCTGLTPTGLLVSFTDEGRTLLGYNTDGNIFSWDVQRGVPLGSRLYKPTIPSQSVSFSSNGRFLAVPNEDGAIVWEVLDERTLPVDDQVNSLVFRPGNNTLAVGEGGRITIWQPQYSGPYERIQDADEHSEVLNMAYSADGAFLATALNDGTITVRDSDGLLKSRALQRTAPEGEIVGAARIQIHKILFDPRRDSHQLVEAINIYAEEDYAEEDKASSEVIVWNADSGEQLHTLPLPDEMKSITFRPDGKLLAWSVLGSGNRSTVTLWDTVSRKPADNPIQVEAQVTSLTFSPDGQFLAVGLNNGKIELWDKDFTRTAAMEGISGEVVDLVFSPDGAILASATNPKTDLEGKATPGTIALWDMSDIDEDQPEQLGDLLKGHGDAITSMAFSPNGKILASRSDDSAVLLWDVNLPGARTRFCEIVDCERTDAELAPHVQRESVFQWLYRRVRHAFA